MFVFGMLLWIPSFVMVLRGFGGFAEYTLTEDVFWVAMFIISLVIVNYFKPKFMKD
jgi:hypothetical protein